MFSLRNQKSGLSLVNAFGCFVVVVCENPSRVWLRSLRYIAAARDEELYTPEY